MKGLVGIGLFLLFSVCNAEDFNVTKVLDKLAEGYDKRIRPYWGGPPVDIGVTMYFLRIYDMSTKEQSMKSDFYFRQSWMDPRLAFDAPLGINSIALGPEVSDMFWEPDSFMPEGDAKINQDGHMFYRINRDGSVLKSVRYMMKSGLTMDLNEFPFDRQVAALSIESYAYSAKDVTYRWSRNQDSVGLSHDVQTHELSVTDFKLHSQTIYLSTGNYSRLAVELFITRDGGFYLRHFYLPAIISFLFTWASFWFHPTTSVVRVFLVLSSFVTGNYLLAQSWNHSPATGYSTKLEKFIVFGLIMSALAIAECVLVVFLQRKARKAVVPEWDHEVNLSNGDKKSEKKQVEDNKESNESVSYIMRSTHYLMTFNQHRRNYHKVDIFFRIVFPLIYIVYNIWYWVSFP